MCFWTNFTFAHKKIDTDRGKESSDEDSDKLREIRIIDGEY